MKPFPFIKRILLLVLLASLAGAMPFSAAGFNSAAAFHRYLPIAAGGAGLSQLGLEGGSITAFTNCPSDNRRMYAGTWGGGVFRSEDAGLSWTETNAGLGNFYIQSIAVDPQNAAVVYAGTYRSGVYKTTDAGASWVQAARGLNVDSIVYDLAVDPHTPTTLYAGTRSPGTSAPWGGGVYKTVDGGQNWTRQNNGLAEDWVYGLAVDPTNPSTLYAALHTQGIAKSVDGARTWQSINSGLDDLSGRTVAVDPQNPRTLYFGTWHYGVAFKSTNGGASWQPARSGLTGTKVYKLYVDPVDPSILYAATFLKGIYRTTNGGSGWDLVGFGTEFVTSMAVDRGSHTSVLAGTAGAGLFRSPDGGRNWLSSQQGLRAGTVLGLAVDPAAGATSVYAGLVAGGAARSRDGGQTWLTANTGMGDRTVAAMAVSPANSQVVFAATDLYGVLKSNDAGSTWQQTSASAAALSGAKQPARPAAVDSDFIRVVQAEDALLPTPKPPSGTPPGLVASTFAYAVQALAVDRTNPATLYMGTDLNGVYKSTNSGANWSQSGLAGKPIYALAIDPTRPLYMYAATDGPSGSLWKTKDGGATWNQRYGGIQNLPVYAVLIDPANVSVMYCGTSNGVYRSTDVGVNWLPAGLSGQAVNALVFYQGQLAAGAAGGLYLSGNGGQTWEKRSSGIFDVTVLAIGPQADAPLYLGTRGRGGLGLRPFNAPLK